MQGGTLLSRKPGDPGDFRAGWRRGTVGEGRRPNTQRARLRGVGRSRSTAEPGEQSRPGGGGACGGKGTGQGKRLTAGRGPDAAPETRVVRSVRRTVGGTSGQTDAVHRTAAPRDTGTAAGELSRPQTSSGSRHRRRDVARLRGRTGNDGSPICTTGFIAAPIGHNPRSGPGFPKRMDGSVPWASRLWKTKSSNRP